MEGPPPCCLESGRSPEGVGVGVAVARPRHQALLGLGCLTLTSSASTDFPPVREKWGLPGTLGWQSPTLPHAHALPEAGMTKPGRPLQSSTFLDPALESRAPGSGICPLSRPSPLGAAERQVWNPHLRPEAFLASGRRGRGEAPTERSQQLPLGEVEALSVGHIPGPGRP